MAALRRLQAWLRMDGQLRPGMGRLSGTIALVLGVLSLLAVCAFHFPEYLTTPELRKKYDVALLRQLLFGTMVLSGGMSVGNLLLGRSRWLASAAFTCVALAALFGGHRVPVGDFADGTPYVGLDWFIRVQLSRDPAFIGMSG